MEDIGVYLEGIGDLPTSWRVVPFETLTLSIRNGLYKPKEHHGAGARIVNMGELFAHPRLGDVEMKRLQVTESELERFGLEDGDLLFARRSLVAEGAGKCSIVASVSEPTVFESSIIRARVDGGQANPAYLYYLWNSPFGKYALGTIRRQVAVAGITGTDLAKLEVPLPPFDEQRAIASVLGSLDDKIELNRRMNRTLEQMAAAIFKAWFVDFEPVRAKASGAASFTGMPQPVFDALPATFADSELGPIPEGWEVNTVSDFATLSKDSVKPQEHAEETFDHFSIPAFDSGQTPSVDTGKSIKSNKFGVIGGSILISKLNPRIPRVWLPPNANGRRQIASTEFLVICPKDESARAFLWCQFRQAVFADDMAQRASGTSGSHQRVKPNDFMSMPVIQPEASVIEAFSALVVPKLGQIEGNRTESQTLAEIRDALLPKLLAGAVRLGEQQA